jgi:hypothetical protein
VHCFSSLEITDVIMCLCFDRWKMMVMFFMLNEVVGCCWLVYCTWYLVPGTVPVLYLYLYSTVPGTVLYCTVVRVGPPFGRVEKKSGR